MITIAEELKQIILDAPLLEQGIAEGIINLSALARKVKPALDKKLMKTVSESAIMMALKRLIPKIPTPIRGPRSLILDAGDLTVRSNLIEYTFINSTAILARVQELLKHIQDQRDNFITFTQGIYEITVIANRNLELDIIRIFKNEKIITTLSDLSAISIRLTPETVNTPGSYYSILKQLAWHHINVVEFVSTYTEFTIILRKENVDFSFSVLHKFLAR